MNSIIVKSREELIKFINKNDLVDWKHIENDQIILSGNPIGIKIPSYIIGNQGICKHCNKNITQYFFRHQLCCEENPDRDPEIVEQFKKADKIRLSRYVICSCGQRMRYFSMSKHFKTQKHIKKTNVNEYRELN